MIVKKIDYFSQIFCRLKKFLYICNVKEIPKTKTVRICDAERFAIGLRDLFKECNVKEWNVLQTTFKDGSIVGNKILAEYACYERNSLM